MGEYSNDGPKAKQSEELSGVYPTPKPLREQITVEWKMAQKIRR